MSNFISEIKSNKNKVNLDDRVKNAINDVKKLFLDYSSGLFVFGSTSRGLRRYDSDIDILLLIPNVEMSGIECRRFKRKFYNNLWDISSKYDIDFDLKVYGELNFKNYCKEFSFESQIYDDLVHVDYLLN